jgi:hypothetical protein
MSLMVISVRARLYEFKAVEAGSHGGFFKLGSPIVFNFSAEWSLVRAWCKRPDRSGLESNAYDIVFRQQSIDLNFRIGAIGEVLQSLPKEDAFLRM